MKKKESVDLESKLEAVLYWACKTSGLSRDALLGLAKSDQQKWSYQAQREREKEAQEKKERARKELLIAKLAKNPPPCPKCGSKARYRDEVGPEGVTAQFWTGAPGPYWKLSFECLNDQCRLLFEEHPDAPDESKNIVIDPKDIAIEEEEE